MPIAGSLRGQRVRITERFLEGGSDELNGLDQVARQRCVGKIGRVVGGMAYYEVVLDDGTQIQDPITGEKWNPLCVRDELEVLV